MSEEILNFTLAKSYSNRFSMPEITNKCILLFRRKPN